MAMNSALLILSLIRGSCASKLSYVISIQRRCLLVDMISDRLWYLTVDNGRLNGNIYKLCV